MRKIPLTQGKFALVDDEDYEALAKHKWQFNHHYARRDGPRPRRLPIWMHRVITNAPPGMQVDHINGDTLDNRKSNLRICTRAQNQANRKRDRDSPSRFKGVHLRKDNQKYVAGIIVNGRRKHLGQFQSDIEAAKAYDAAAIALRGEYARVNFPREIATA